MNTLRTPVVASKKHTGINHHAAQRLSRSPHPYHRRGTSSLATKERDKNISHLNHGSSSDEPSLCSPSESGTEADDERGSILKGLPASPVRPRKGLRGGAPVDKTPLLSPLPTPPICGNKSQHLNLYQDDGVPADRRAENKLILERYTRRRRAEIVRRTVEVSLLLLAGYLASYGGDATQGARVWQMEIASQLLIVAVLYLAVPFRHSYRAFRAGRTLPKSIRDGFHVASGFEPGPFLYPVFLPPLIALSLLCQSQSFILANLMVSLSSLPPSVIPGWKETQSYSVLHWALTIIPLVVSENNVNTPYMTKPSALFLAEPWYLNAEVLVLLYPLQRFTLSIVHSLTTTSLDPAELQLLSSALANVFLFSTSPQSEILKALLWLGGIGSFVLCERVLAWEVALARVPTWRFQRAGRQDDWTKPLLKRFDKFLSKKLVRFGVQSRDPDTSESNDEFHDKTPITRSHRRNSKIDLSNMKGRREPPPKNIPACGLEMRRNDTIDVSIREVNLTVYSSTHRRHTFSTFDQTALTKVKTTTGGRLRRSLDPSSSSFLSFTANQARRCKWLYAAYVYAAVIFIVLVPIRWYVSVKALSNHEPFGWALGYLLGDWSRFRFWTISANLERWIVLPIRVQEDPKHHLGWVDHVRQDIFGQANTRLILCAYCVVVLGSGIAVVLRPSTAVEVDTRRKVFHGVMVAMFLPTIFVDPCFTALAFTLILAIFLVLDLFRASQLPPISKPLTHFLAPYVDGRDYRGPVIVSHIFLLIGCAIPLWLSLAGAPRSGTAPWNGWDTCLRSVGMVSGVVCVGMGDAAASLIGRRFGRHKWFWRGGKSLEGSLAFVAAVTVGLMVAFSWLRIGGWVKVEEENWAIATAKAMLAASGASLLESVLTGANDNVVVPVVLWLLVRGLGL